MRGCRLNSLENLPHLPDLIRLDLSNNSLLGKDLANVANNYPKLETLKLSNNLIKGDWENLKVTLMKLGETLINLDVSSNPISDNGGSNYREMMFELIPSLEVLDGYDKAMNPIDSDNEETDELCNKQNYKSRNMHEND